MKQRKRAANRVRRPGRAWTLGFVAAWAGLTGAASADPIDPAVWCPADAVCYVGTDDVAALWRHIQATAAYRMLQDPAARAASAEVSAAYRFFEGLNQRLARLLQSEPDALRSPFSGPMALYVPASVAAAGALRAVLIATVADRESMRGMFDRAVARLGQQAGGRENVSFLGYEIVCFRAAAPAAGAAPIDPDEDALTRPREASGLAALAAQVEALLGAETPPAELALCLAGDRLIVAAQVEDVRAALRGPEGGRVLRDRAEYRALERGDAAAGALRYFVDAPAALDLGLGRDEREAKFRAALGLGALRALVGQVAFDGREYEYRCDALLAVSGDRHGLARLATPENRPIDPPRGVPADAALLVTVQLEPSNMWDAWLDVLRRTDPSQATELASAAAAFGPPDAPIDLRKELLARLRGPLTIWLAPGAPTAVDAARLVVSLGCTDSSTIGQVFDRLAPLAGGAITARETGGRRVFEFGPAGVALATGREEVLLGTRAAVERAIGGESTASLVDDPTFRKALALAPREAWALIFVDRRRLLEARLAAAVTRPDEASTDLGERFAASVVGSAAGQPGARELLRFQAAAIATLATTPEGLRFTSLQLLPPAEAPGVTTP